jgi:hypothetical protein
MQKTSKLVTVDALRERERERERESYSLENKKMKIEKIKTRQSL